MVASIIATACSVAALLVLAGATPAFATNGMNLEGYGSKSMAMGGAGMAYDTGNSAVMNNPATLGFMAFFVAIDASRKFRGGNKHTGTASSTTTAKSDDQPEAKE